jgi:hypothetical protein
MTGDGAGAGAAQAVRSRRNMIGRSFFIRAKNLLNQGLDADKI